MGWDIFISHCNGDDSSIRVYEYVSAYMISKGLRVFNPTTEFAHYEATSEGMEDCVRRSTLVLAALSEGFFASKYCRAEVNAARESNIKVIPIYSGDYYHSNQGDIWVQDFKSDLVFKYIFKENIRDVLNKQNRASTTGTLNYLASLLIVDASESESEDEDTDAEDLASATKKFKELLIEKSWHYSDIFGGGREPTLKNLKNEVINEIYWPGDSKQRFLAHLDGNSWHRGLKKATRTNLERLADNFR